VNARSLKFRLVVWYAGSLTILFIAFAIINYTSLRHEMERAVRSALSRRARHVALAVERSAPDWEALAVEIHSRFTPEANNRFTRVTVDGVVQYVSGVPEDQSFDPATVPPAPRTAVPQETFARRDLPDGRQLYVHVLPITEKGFQLIIEGGASAEPIDEALRQRINALAIGLALLSLVAGAGGFVLLQRALGPVDQIIQSAERISSRNLDERLPVPDTGDELHRLSVALNHMIRRLEEAVQQNRRFLADASHELRTPLAILQGELDAVMDKARAGQPVGETIDIIASAQEELERLRKIVETLFALSRLDAGEAQAERVPVNLGELAATTAEQMCLLAEDKQIAIACECPLNVVVQGDRARLKQVLVNLLDNAIKYTPAGGHVKVRVSARNGAAVAEVTDDGLGIPPEALPHVFERFFRVDKARSRSLGSAGLGLSIVKAICAAHEGRVEVQSQPGKGTRFTVELPLSDAPELAASAATVTTRHR